MPRMLRTAALACLLLALVPAAAAAASRSATARALDAQMRSAGPSSGALVVDLDTGDQIYALRADTPRMPASVEKLYTSATTLRRLGASGRLSTTVLAETAPDAGRRRRRRPLPAGGGDPTFDVLDSNRLAQQVADAGIVEVTGRVIGDESAFDARRGVPSSAFRLTSEVGPLSALTFNRGRTGRRAPYWQNRPANFAAAAFTKQLRAPRRRRRRGARRGRTRGGRRPARRVALAARHRAAAADEPAVGQLHGRDAVKVLGDALRRRGQHRGRRRVSSATSSPSSSSRRRSSTARGSRARTARRPRDVVALLDGARAATPRSSARSPWPGAAGRSRRACAARVAQDRCRAKTGTLRDVSALAGYCTTTSGRQVAFAFLMNYVSP